MFSSEDRLKACRRFEARLEDYVEGTVSSADAAQVESHLSGCARCRQALEAARSTEGLWEALREPVREPRPGFARRVMAAISAEEGRVWRPLETLSRRLSWSAMAAVALLLLYFVGFQLPRNSKPATAQPVEVQDIFPESAPHPANQDDMLLTLASANSGK